jgi:diguanylate cyclase (GGDEF)-like protein
MFDLDDFKAYNDTFGHPRGDALLKAVSGVVQSNLRTMDVAARYGGEEFVVVLPETDTEGALAVGERIREGVEAIRLEGPESAPVLKTVSVGVATFPHHAASSLRLLESADAAMYRAKRAGKNRVVSAGS